MATVNLDYVVLCGDTVAYFLLSSVGFSYSQGSGSGLEPDQDNVTNLTDVCPMNLSCSELSPQCIMCDFNTNCKYGMETNVTCSPRETVECEVRVRVLFHSLHSLIIPLLIPHPPPSLSHSQGQSHIHSQFHLQILLPVTRRHEVL